MVIREVPCIHDTDQFCLEGFENHGDPVEQEGGGRGELLVEVLPRELREKDYVWHPHLLHLHVYSGHIPVIAWLPTETHKTLENYDNFDDLQLIDCYFHGPSIFGKAEVHTYCNH